jgi:hypothetical protein
MPKSALGMTFGKQSGSSRSIETLIHKYQHAIFQGAGSPVLYVPKIPFLNKSALTQLFNSSLQLVEQAIGTWTEDELDTYLLPHPILGKITARELFGFTAYHLYHQGTCYLCYGIIQCIISENQTK